MRAALVVVLLVAGVVVFSAVNRAESDAGSRCARYAADAAAREHVAAAAPADVAVIGDSWSVGLGLDDPGRSWPSYLPGQVRVLGFSGAGFSAGASPCPGVSFADRAARAVGGADLVVVQGGLNDHDQASEAVRAGVRRLLAVLDDHRVVLVGPASAPSRAAAVGRIDALLAEEAARAGVRHVSTLELSLDYLPDRLHLTATGHQAYGEAVAAALTG